jgi:hypothetical protein
MLDKSITDNIPDHWYQKTATKFICLRCKRSFSREYKPKSLRGRKGEHGSNMFSLWAWYNFRRHLLKCRTGGIGFNKDGDFG